MCCLPAVSQCLDTGGRRGKTKDTKRENYGWTSLDLARPGDFLPRSRELLSTNGHALRPTSTSPKKKSVRLHTRRSILNPPNQLSPKQKNKKTSRLFETSTWYCCRGPALTMLRMSMPPLTLLRLKISVNAASAAGVSSEPYREKQTQHGGEAGIITITKPQTTQGCA